MFGWFSAAQAESFGKELAGSLLKELEGSMGKGDAKFSAKAEKALLRADVRVTEFKRATKLNFYQRGKLANAFLWSLKDAGCSPDYADKLTDWLTVRL